MAYSRRVCVYLGQDDVASIRDPIPCRTWHTVDVARQDAAYTTRRSKCCVCVCSPLESCVCVCTRPSKLCMCVCVHASLELLCASVWKVRCSARSGKSYETTTGQRPPPFTPPPTPHQRRRRCHRLDVDMEIDVDLDVNVDVDNGRHRRCHIVLADDRRTFLEASDPGQPSGSGSPFVVCHYDGVIA